MRLVELVAWPVRIPLKKPIRHASHTRTETDNMVVRCKLSDGSTGYGEGVPREYVTGETITTALELLKRSDVPAQIGDATSFADAVRQVEAMRLAPVEGDERKCQGNAARCAVELALLDAFGRAFGQPVSEVTRILAPDLFEPKDEVRYSGAITSASGWKVRWAAWKMWIYGFQQLKIKVGITGQNDVDRVGAIRNRVGRKMELRVDANEAWSPDEAAKKILELKPFGITSFEQPVPHDQVGCLRKVREETQAAIMLDESLCGMVDAERAVVEKTCDLFNLRLSKCGGFIPSLRLAQYATMQGLGYQVGCQIGETAILSAAGRHFAGSVRAIRNLEGSYDKHLVKEALGTTDLTFGWGGKAATLKGPGLGFDVDPAALERVAGTRETIVG